MKAVFGTRKALIQFEKTANGWKFLKDDFLGFPVTMFHINKFTGRWFCGLYHGHWGEKLHFSDDKGKTWHSIETPKFPKGSSSLSNGKPAVVQQYWSMASCDEKIYLGTIPGALFESFDNGESFELVESVWEQETRKECWFGAGFDEPGIHTIEINPFNNKQVFLGISCAGVLVTEDAGQTWNFKNKGLNAPFLPNPKIQVGHDPHLFLMNKSKPDTFWMQAHLGIYKSTDGAENWIEVTKKDIGLDFGFTVAVDNDNPDRAWFIPAKSDEQRVAYNYGLKVVETNDGGNTWIEHTKGLPQNGVYDFVFRHAFDHREKHLAFGTCTGNAFASNDGGKNWEHLSCYLPMVHTVDIIDG